MYIYICIQIHRILFKINILANGYTFKFTCNYFIFFPDSLSLTIWKILMKTQVAKKLALKIFEAILAIFNPTFLEMINELK